MVALTGLNPDARTVFAEHLARIADRDLPGRRGTAAN
jgi:hypothetical protein